MATFLPYAFQYDSQYGNKHQLQPMGTPRRSRHRNRAPATSGLTLMHLTQLIRVLRKLPHQTPIEEPQRGGTSLSTVSTSGPCHPKSFRNHCLLCTRDHCKHAG